ncbi:uncharacterized protein PHACADRAFT_253023 [Phanerochaete carnosa HHB-10118-sp]|uniref:F-box domain-containing protein n=1 Tax=Phanerochaete carnosa (strain HHB-10118-sp) TaxID=650164 RepID=K5WGW7_PHACS|nr:uncharacterized protein PHACADRAFT_253023 [Phanerochaete carnosa HHB-10118-sp]EKM58575.1 hypothetical protein PHACADRAFT_253023 [Phanerochaete carnosa HHB-10118-sp]
MSTSSTPPLSPLQSFNDTANSLLVFDRFPVEVFDVVFDFVRIEDERGRTDKRTLFSCSRVSKAWHSLTLRHRFHSVSLFARTGNPYEQRIRKNCFLQDFVRSPLFPTVQSYIQRLTLRWGIADLDPYIGADLPGYLPLFPALRSLKLRGLLGRRIPAPPLQHPPVLDSLCIEGWVCHARSHDPRVLFDVLSCFDSIGELQLEDLCQWLPADGLELGENEHPRVSSLVLRDSTCQHPVCDILESAIAHEKPLRRLDLRALSSTDARGGVDLLESFSRTIEDFQCAISSTGDTVSSQADASPPFDFSQLPLLRTLTVAVALPLSRTRARSVGGGEDLDKAAPWDRAIASLDTLRARARPSGALKLLRLQLAPARALADKAQTAASVLEALRRHDASVRALERALLALVEARCVQLVQIGVYTAPPASGLRGACQHRCDEFVLGLFPKLRQAGVLRA